MLKIVFVHSVAKVGGAERVSQMLMTGLNHNEFSTQLVCPQSGEMSDWAKKHNISFTLLPLDLIGVSNLASSVSQTTKWIRFLKSQKIDFIHAADPYCVRAISVAAKICNVKVLAHYHFPFEYDTLLWLMRRFPKPNCAVFCSEDLHEDVGPKITKIGGEILLRTVHNGVDVDKFSPSFEKSKGNKNIAIVANLQKRKGHDEFINMAYILCKRYKALNFHIIGGDILQEPRQALLEDMVAKLHLKECFTFHGQVDDVLSLIDSMDIIVCASHQEAFPIAILEAMAMQKPIVSTNVNGIPEAIENNSSGILVEPFSAQQLADGVRLLLDNPSFANELSIQARATVKQKFNSTLFISKFESLYKDII